MSNLNNKNDDEKAKEGVVQSMSNWVNDSFSSLNDFSISNLERTASASSPTELYHYLLDEDLKNDKVVTFEKYLSLLKEANDQAFTAILVPDRGSETKDTLFKVKTKTGTTIDNNNDLKGVKNILMSNSTGDKENETYKEFVYTLTFPTVDKATFNRQFTYAKEPIPSGENVSEFMMRGNIHLVLEGTVSNIQCLKKNLDPKPQIKTSALSTIADGVSNMMWNKYGSALKEKCFKLINSSTVTSKALGAYNLVSEYNRKFGITNTITNALNRGASTEDKSPKSYNGQTNCQFFINNFNRFYGEKGVLMTVYFMGIVYTNMALIDMRIDSTPKSGNAMHVSLHFEQQQLVKKQTTTKATGGSKTPNKINTTSKKIRKSKRNIRN